MRLRPSIGNHCWRGALLLVLALSFLAVWLVRQPSRATPDEPLDVIQGYFRAIHARDFGAAYGHISSLDRRVRSKADYLGAQESFHGFALRLARKWSEETVFRIVAQEIKSHRARVTLDYRIPAGDELAAQLLDWDQERLNALSPDAQRRLLAAAERLAQSGNGIATEGRETFDLVKEDAGWKIFLDWASRTKVSFAAALPRQGALEVQVLQRELFTDRDETLQTHLKVRNRGPKPIVARIHHRIEPRELAECVTMVACGFLTPLTLQPGEEREIASAYLLDPTIPKSTGVTITFEFDLAHTPLADNLIGGNGGRRW